jgi:hypothetical protein
MKCTRYFESIRSRPDRAVIREEWIVRAIESPIREVVQADGRIRRWTQVPEMGNRFLRVVCYRMGRRCTMLSLIDGSSHENPLLC